jgi:hypothetical protein
VAELKEKKVRVIRLKVNIHLGGKRYAGKGSIIRGSEGWMGDLINSNQAEAVGDNEKEKIEEMEHVKPLTFTNAADGKPLTEVQIKRLTETLRGEHSAELEEALAAQAKVFQEKIDELTKLVSAKKDK